MATARGEAFTNYPFPNLEACYAHAVREGRRILVTGAATGIGAAAIQVFHANGARVAAIHHQSPPPEPLAQAATWVQADLRTKPAVMAAFDIAGRALGGLDVLLHSAGFWRPSALDTLDDEQLDFLLATNVKSTIYANQAAFHHMKDRGGAIVNLGSAEGITGNASAPAYSLTKAAVHAWTRSAARGWGQYGITVNSLAPAVETPGADRFWAHLGAEGTKMVEAHLAATRPIASSLGRGKLGDPVRDLGPMLVFLASPGAHFITGQILPVDGGLVMLGA